MTVTFGTLARAGLNPGKAIAMIKTKMLSAH
jgi:hypothetical protein